MANGQLSNDRPSEIVGKWAIVEPEIVGKWAIVEPEITGKWAIVEPEITGKWAIVKPEVAMVSKRAKSKNGELLVKLDLTVSLVLFIL